MLVEPVLGCVPGVCGAGVSSVPVLPGQPAGHPARLRAGSSWDNPSGHLVHPLQQSTVSIASKIINPKRVKKTVQAVTHLEV